MHLISPVYQLHLFGVNSNALSLVSCIRRHGRDAIIECEIVSDNEDLDLWFCRSQ